MKRREKAASAYVSGNPAPLGELVARDGFSDQRPVFLTATDANPNGAAVRFFVDGADGTELSGYARIVHLFDGRDEDARARAREQWKRAKAEGHAVTFWQQNDRWRWEKKA